MTADQGELLEKARISLTAAKLLLEGSLPDFAASRAYYVMFYVAQAFLEGEGMAFSRHSAVIAAFGREFARLGRVRIEFHQYLLKAQETRQSGDYGPPHAVTLEEAAEQIANAERFFELAERLIAPLPPSFPEGTSTSP
ncbi:MAG: HEPN domain-containing protein [Candidatus Entotheonellia bacterium]